MMANVFILGTMFLLVQQVAGSEPEMRTEVEGANDRSLFGDVFRGNDDGRRKKCEEDSDCKKREFCYEERLGLLSSIVPYYSSYCKKMDFPCKLHKDCDVKGGEKCCGAGEGQPKFCQDKCDDNMA